MPKVSPVIMQIPYFEQRLSSIIQPNKLLCKPFYAFEEGYKMCLKVYVNGVGSGEGTHVSVYLYLMKGPHDDKLEQSDHWPLRGTFTIELLSQLNDKHHKSIANTFYSDLCQECSSRVMNNSVAPQGWGSPEFIPHSAILHHNKTVYLQNNTLHFRISYSDVNTVMPYNQVAPVTLKVPNIYERIKGKEQSLWYSGPLFTFTEGYQMCFVVFAAGVGNGEGTHISVFLHLMKGPYDDKLEQSGHWPFRGTFTIQLLNQHFDGNHRGHRVYAYSNKSSTSTNRVLHSTLAPTGWSDEEFISHESIFHQGDIDFVENNALYFRITYEANHLISYNQYSPIFKISNFTAVWLNSAKMWSSKFYAFEEGYHMCLRVNAAGFGDGEGTHVSIGLHLLKGPHDDKLEQSGHYPLRGIFTIELLNQLNDSNHHYHQMLFSKDQCNDIAREIGDVFGEGCGISKFISHNSLHQSNYLINDTVYFKVYYDKINI